MCPSKLSAVASTIHGRLVWQTLHRGTPAGVGRTRFLVPQFGHVVIVPSAAIDRVSLPDPPGPARLSFMGKTWILDTETKGTGAHVAPLEKVKKPSSEQDLVVVALERPPRTAESIEPPAALMFKIVDVRSSRVLAEGIGAHETLELLEGIASVVDISIYVWMRTSKRWRLLTLAERRALWDFRGQAPVAAIS